MKRSLILTLSVFLLLAVPPNAFSASVQEVIDGRTLKLSDGQTVLLIGVETADPADMTRNKRAAERLGVSAGRFALYGEKTKPFLEKLILGKAVRLTYDPQNAGTGHRDKEGKTPAYMHEDDGVSDLFVVFAKLAGGLYYDKGPGGLNYLSVNGTLIKSGYAAADKLFSYEHRDVYTKLEENAKRQKRGMWGFF